MIGSVAVVGSGGDQEAGLAKDVTIQTGTTTLKLLADRRREVRTPRPATRLQRRCASGASRDQPGT
jgi:hypothetical protein